MGAMERTMGPVDVLSLTEFLNCLPNVVLTAIIVLAFLKTLMIGNLLCIFICIFIIILKIRMEHYFVCGCSPSNDLAGLINRPSEKTDCIYEATVK